MSKAMDTEIEEYANKTEEEVQLIYWPTREGEERWQVTTHLVGKGVFTAWGDGPKPAWAKLKEQLPRIRRKKEEEKTNGADET